MNKKSWVSIVLSFSKECKGKMILSVILAVLSVFSGIIPYFGVYQIINLFFNENINLERLVYWSTICAAGYILKMIFYGISTTLSHVSAYTILENMRLKMARRLMEAPLGTVLNTPIGKLKNILVDRVETIELPLAHVIPEGISNTLLPLGVLIYLISVDWRMALASMVTVPIAFIIYGIMMKNFNEKYNDYMESNNYVNGVIVEYVEGIEVIKAFNQSSSSYEKFSKAVDSFKDYTLRWFKSTWKLMNLGGALLPSTLIGVVPIGMFLYMKGSLTPSELTISIILSLGIVAPLTSFTVFANDAKAIESAIVEVNEILNLEILPTVDTPVSLSNYNIKLNNVSFSYDKSDNNVLNNVTLTLSKGSFNALVGPSGSGKSTIARLVARFFDVTHGEIKIGDTNIKDIPLSQLSNIVSFVTQDNFLFNCSLMENIRIGNPNATDKEVIEAAKMAQCHDFIKALDNGYETFAGDAGNKLSGGEKQRIAIARAILKNAPIIILDEATAFTDPENEYNLQRSIASLTKGKTLLVIAHRLSTIKNADQIIVLDKGSVLSKGTHSELLNNCPLYHNMYMAHIGSKKWAANSEKGALIDV